MANPAVVPISVQKARPPRIKRGRMTILTPQEMLDLLKAARKRSTRDWAMILLAYRHGLRASEACGIKLAVKGGEKLDRRGGAKIDHFGWRERLICLELQG
jgi:integrase